MRLRALGRAFLGSGDDQIAPESTTPAGTQREPNAQPSSLPPPVDLETVLKGAAAYQEAGKNVRDAAKWLIAAYAVIASTLVAGTQLSSIGDLDSGGRLAAAAIGAAVALASIAWLIRMALDILTPAQMTIGDLVRLAEDRPRFGLKRKVVDYVERNPSLMLGYCQRLDQLADNFARAAERQWTTYREARAHPDDAKLRRAAEEAAQEANTADAVTRQVLLSAQLYLLRQKAERWALIVAALLAAAGIVLFAWAANPGSTG